MGNKKLRKREWISLSEVHLTEDRMDGDERSSLRGSYVGMSDNHI